MRHDRPRDPLGPGTLRRRCSAAAGGQLPVASASRGPLRGDTSRLLSGPAAHRRAHALDARFSRPRRAGVLTLAVRRALGPGRLLRFGGVLAQSGLEAGPKEISVEGERRAVGGAEGRKEEGQWRAGLEAGLKGRNIEGGGWYQREKLVGVGRGGGRGGT